MQEKTAARGTRRLVVRRRAASRPRALVGARARDADEGAAKWRSDRVFFLQSQNRDPTVKQLLAAAKNFFVAEATPNGVGETCRR